jgi:hypothetical protein
MYIVLGRVQELVGLEAGLAVGFSMVIPALVSLR